jgi:hypothetical protein
MAGSVLSSCHSFLFPFAFTGRQVLSVSSKESHVVVVDAACPSDAQQGSDQVGHVITSWFVIVSNCTLLNRAWQWGQTLTCVP